MGLVWEDWVKKWIMIKKNKINRYIREGFWIGVVYVKFGVCGRAGGDVRIGCEIY